MPIIRSKFKAKGLFKSGHFSTIYSAKIRPIPKVVQVRKRLELAEGDFVDIDWSYCTAKGVKSQKVQELQKIKQQKDLENCTFKPQIIKY